MSSKPKAMTVKKNGEPELKTRLRFPEFRDAGGWESSPLGSVCEILNNRRIPITSAKRVAGPYPYYGASGIVDFIGEYIFDERLLLVGEDGAKWDAFEKTAFIAEGKYWVNNHAHVLKPTGVNDTLLENYLTMADLGPFVTGAAPPKLTLGKLKVIPVPVPSLTDEQQKIADCLTSVDDLIAAQARKVDALMTHKKGLMQQLFPREGETQPRLRFPEFRDAGGWGECSGDAIFEQINERNPDRSLPILAITQEHGAIPRDVIDYHVSVTDKSIETYKVVQVGDFIISLRSFQGGIEYSKYHGICSPVYVILRRRIEGSDVYFKHYLKTNRFIRLLTKNLEGLRDGKMVSYTQFSEISIPIPSPAEQQKIADCLTSVDDLIAAQARKVDALKTHKKGLMQQLFPSPKDVDA